MRKTLIILLFLSMALCGQAGVQSLGLKGTVTAYGSVFSDYQSGGQFIPVIEGDFLSDTSRYIFDFELSGDSYVRYDTVNQFTPGISPYRAWLRFAGNQFEVRVGLQKITFGKAMLLRTENWFDTMDPRDPLGLTQGVWAERIRYYIPGTNANIWLWSIQENLDNSSFIIPLESDVFTLVNHFGGRLEMPMLMGEIGLSFNTKASAADTASITGFIVPGTEIPVYTLNSRQYQAGIDGKWDKDIGFWFEAAYINDRSDFTFMAPNSYILTEMAMLTLGIDYTLGIGNGLTIICEYMGDVIRSEVNLGSGKTASVTTLNILGLMLSYPMGIFDSMGLMGIVDLDSGSLYSYLYWRRQYDNLTLQLSGALTNFDADVSLFPGQSGGISIGNMIQVMAIYDFRVRIF